MTQPEFDKLRTQVNRLRTRMRELALATGTPLELCVECGKPRSAVGVANPKCIDCTAAELDELAGVPISHVYRNQLEVERLTAKLMLALAVRKIEKAGETAKETDDGKNA